MTDLEPQEFVRIHGGVYRCTLRYASINALDPLLQFLYDALASESKISALRQSFGLPVRLIEDSLAELIKRNLAALDVRKGAIVRIANAAPAPGHRLRTDSMFWQDQLTGAILPTWVAQRYKARRPGAITLSSAATIVDFGDLPDGQLVPAIQRIQPELAFDHDYDWALDRVIDRVRIYPLSIWVPVTTVRAGLSVTRFIDAPEVPFWVSRSWAASYQQRLAAAGDARSAFVVVPSSEEEGGNEHGLEYQAAAWSQAALNVLTVTPAPQSQYDLRELRQRTANAQACLRSLATADVTVPAPELTHLDEILRRAENLVVLSLGVLTSAVGKRLRAIFASRTNGWPFDLCLLVGSTHSQEERQRLEDLKAALKAHFPARLSLIDAASQPGVLADFALVDGEDAWIGTPETLVSRRPAVHLRGAETVRSLFALVERHLPDSSLQGHFWLHHHHAANALVSPADMRPFAGGLAGESVSDVMRHLDEIVQLVRYGVEKPSLLAQALAAAGDEVPEAGEDDHDDHSDAPEMQYGSLEQTWPRLFSRYVNLAQALRAPLQPQYGTVSFVGLVEETTLIERLIAKRPNAGDAVRVLVRDFAPEALSNSSLELIRGALRQHWPVHIAFAECGVLSHREAHDLLRERIQDSRVQIHSLREAPPSSLISIGTVSIVSSRSWLDESGPDSPESFTAFVTSVELASGLERLFKDLSRSL